MPYLQQQVCLSVTHIWVPACHTPHTYILTYTHHIHSHTHTTHTPTHIHTHTPTHTTHKHTPRTLTYTHATHTHTYTHITQTYTQNHTHTHTHTHTHSTRAHIHTQINTTVWKCRIEVIKKSWKQPRTFQMLPKAISSYITSTFVINYNTAYRILLFIQMTQFAHSRSELRINIILYYII